MTHGTGPRSPLLRQKLAAFAVASCFAGYAQANPGTPTVISGSASFQSVGKSLAVTSSPGAIINWQAFSIQADEVTRFIQQNAASSVLNRVTGSANSSILGQLLSNGRVFLINPNGIFIGGGAVVDVAGFVASSLNLSNADFLAGKFKFTEQVGAGRIVNQGTIQTPAGGQVYLVAPSVENSGVITSPSGQVILAAGKTVELVDAGSPYVRVEFTAPDNAAVNVGQVLADAGSVGIYGTTIRNSGVVRANSAQVGANGKIVFKAKTDITLDAGSRLEANGPQGGEISVQAEGGTLLAEGAIEAIGALPPTGAGAAGGGTIQLLGRQVGLIGNARVDASGETGGGTIRVGGDFHGANPEVQNASRTYVGPNVAINADAVTSGDGGKVVVWADGDTRFYGDASARGGPISGNGGFIEISGKQYLDFQGMVSASSPTGAAGTVLFDPTDINIVSGTPSPATPNDGGTPTTIFQEGVTPNATSQIQDTAIKAILDVGTNVTINTNSTASASNSGTITLTSGATINTTVSANDVTLRLNAENDIIVQNNVTVSDAGTKKLNIVLNADSDANGTGRIDFQGTGANPISITTNGGNVTLGGRATLTGAVTGVATGGGTSTTNVGVHLANTTLNAGAGGVTILGKGGNFATGVGVSALNFGAQIEASTVSGGAVSITGTGGDVSDGALGVIIGNSAGTSAGLSNISSPGSITIVGQGGAAGTSNGSDGITLNGGSRVDASGTGTVTFTGTAGTGNAIEGIRIQGIPGSVETTRITSVDGNITLTGLPGTATGNSNMGLFVLNGATVKATGTGSISMTGTSSTAATDNRGILIDGTGLTAGQYRTTVQTNSGSLTLTGVGNATGASKNSGIHVDGGAQIVSTSGPVLLDGTFSGSGSGVGIRTDLDGVGGTDSVILNGGSNSLTLRADTVSLGNVAISGTGSLVIEPKTASTAIGVAGGTGTLLLPTATLDEIAAGFSSITIGKSTGTGALAFGSGGSGYTFNAPVTLQASGSAGTVTVDGALATSNNSISLMAGDTITLNAGRTIASGGGTVVLDADRGANSSGAIVLNSGSSITSGGGKIELAGGNTVDGSGFLNNPAWGTATNPVGVLVYGASVSSGGGKISILGHGLASGAGNEYGGVHIANAGANAASVSSGIGNIAITGTAGGGATGSNNGVLIDGYYQNAAFSTAIVSSSTGNIAVTGTGGTASNGNPGVLLRIGGQVQSTSGDISLTGDSGVGGTALGVDITGYNGHNAFAQTGGSGNIAITGTSHGDSGVQNVGVGILFTNSYVQTAAGNITVIGTASSVGTDQTEGVQVTGAHVTTSTGAISITGVGGGTAGTNNGIRLDSEAASGLGGTVEATGVGTITMTGTAGFGGSGIASASSGGSGGSLANKIGNGTMTGAITLKADSIDIGSNVSVQTTGAGGNVYLLPKTATTAVSIGGAGTGFDLSQTELTNISTNVNSIVVGEDASATVTAGAVTIASGGAVGIGSRNLKVSGDSIALSGALSTTGGQVTLQAATGVTSIGAGTITTTAATGSGVKSGNVSLSVSGTGNVAFSGDVITSGANRTAASSGAASTGGNVTISAANGTTAVANITTSGGNHTGGASGDNGGVAGNIDLSGSGGVTVNGGLTATGGSAILPGTAGTSGTVALASSAGAVGGVGVINTLNNLTVTASSGINLSGNNLATGTVTLNNTNGTPGNNVFYQSGNSGQTFVTGTNAATGGSFGVTETGAANLTVAVGGITTKGGAVNVTAQGSGALLTVTSNIDTTSSTPGGASVTLTADDIALSGTVKAGSGANTVILQPYDASRTINIESGSTAGSLSLTPTEISKVTAATLQIGRTDGAGDLNLTTALASGDVNAATLRLIDNNINLSTASADIGSNGSLSGTPFDHHLELKANNNVQIDVGNIYLADNKNLTILADRDGSGTGDVQIGGVTIWGGTTMVSGTSTGNMSIQGKNISAALSGGGSAAIELFGTGTQSFTADGNITFDNTTDGILNVHTGDTGAQSFTTTSAGNMTLKSSGTGTGVGSVNVQSGGAQTINLSGGLSVQTRTSGNSTAIAGVYSAAGQTIDAKYVDVIANGAGTTGIFNSGIGTQAITTTGEDASQAGVFIQSFAAASDARIQNTSGGAQNITVNDAKYFIVDGRGTGSNATLYSSGNQTILVQGVFPSNNLITVGGGSTAGASLIHGQNQSITAGFDNTQSGTIQVFGGTASYNARIQGDGGTQTVVAQGPIQIAGGTASSGAGAQAAIQNDGLGLQSITAGSIVLSGGSSGLNNSAKIWESSASATGGQSITTTGTGGIILNGGLGSGGNNGALIGQAGTAAPQTITVGAGQSLAINGGTTGSNNNASIGASGTSQTIDLSGGADLTLQGGSSGASNFAQIFYNGNGQQKVLAGAATQISLTGGLGTATSSNAKIYDASSAGMQTINAGTGGIVLQGGSGSGGGNSASIAQLSAGTQGITIANGDLSITGGGGGTGNNAGISSVSTQTIDTGGGDISLFGGTSGTSNSAFVTATGGAQQNITAHNISLTGQGGTTSVANFLADTQVIQATGAGAKVTLTAGSGSGARIGGSGNSNVQLTADSDITLNADAVGTNSATIGGPLTGGPFSNTLTITSTNGSIIGNPTTASAVRFGAPSGLVGGGDIALTAGGNIALNDTASTGTNIRTTGNVTLQATGTGGQITQGANSIILANTLTTSSDSGTSLAGTANAISKFIASNANSSNISLVNTGALALGDASNSIANSATNGNISVTTTGLLTAANTVTSGSGGAVSLTGAGVTNNSTVTGSGGVTIDASTGTFTNASGATSAGTISNGGGATAIGITADKMDLQTGGVAGDSAISGGSGLVTLQPKTAGTAIDLGTTANTGFGLSDAELKTVATIGSLTIGSANAGAITISAAVSPTGVTGGTLTLANGNAVASNINVNDTLTTGAGVNVTLDNTGSGGTGNIAFSGATGAIVADAGTAIVTLTAGGAITTDGTATSNVTALTLNATAASGIGNGTALNTAVQNFTFTNTTNDVQVTNDSGAIGTFTVSGVQNGAGAVTLIENSGNFIVDTPGITTSGGIVTLAAQTTTTNMWVNGLIDTSAGGTVPAGAAVNLRADNLYFLGSLPTAINAGAGDVTLTPKTLVSVIGVEDSNQGFNITDMMLGQISTTGTVVLGEAANLGGINWNVDGDINKPSMSLKLWTGGNITQDVDAVGSGPYNITAKNLTLNAGGSIDDPNSMLGVLYTSGGGKLELVAGTTINALTGTDTLAAAAPDGITISNTAPSGTLTLDTVGATSGLRSTGGAISLTETAGSIAQTASGIVRVGADGSSFTTGTADQAITLGSANVFNGKDVAFTTSGALGDVAITGDALKFATTSVGGKLVATAGTGTITQSGTITVGADGSNFTTSTADQAITLGGANVFNGKDVAFNTSGTSGDVTITGDALKFATTGVGGKLVATASTGTITQSDTVTVGANGSSFTTSTADRAIALGGANVFNGKDVAFNTSGTSGDVTITGDALKFAASTVNGILVATASSGTITQGGAITVSGTSSFDAGTNAITLLDGSNDFVEAVTLISTGASVSVRGTNDLALASPTLGANTGITAIAGGTLTLPGYNFSTGTGSIDFQSNGGSLATNGSLTTTSGNISLTGSPGIDVGHDLTTSGGNITLNNAAAVSGTRAVGAGSGNISMGAVTLADAAALTLTTTGTGTIGTGSISGTPSGPKSDITFDAGGAVTVAGAVGTDMGVVTITNSNGAAFQSTMNAATVTISDTAATKTVDFQDNLTVGTGMSAAGTGNAYKVRLGGATNSIAGASATTFANTGTLTLTGGTSTFANGLTHTAGSTTVNGTLTATDGAVQLGGTTLTGTINASGTGGAVNTTSLSATGATDAINGGTISTGNITIADSDTLTLTGTTIDTGSITGANLVATAGTTSNVSFNGSSAVTVAGAVGTDIGTVTVTNSNGAAFQSTVNADTVTLSNTAATKTVDFQDNLTVNTGMSAAGTGNAYNVRLGGASNSIAGASATTFANTGTLTLTGGTSTFANGVTHTAGTGTTVNGTVTATAGNVSLGATGLTGTINASSGGVGTTSLAANGASDAINGGTISTGNITIADSDTLTLTGTTIDTGSITGANLVATAGTTSNVSFNGSSAVTVAGAVGTDIGTVTVTNSNGAAFQSTVNADTVTLSDTTGTIAFGGALTATTFNTAAKPYGVAFNGGGTITTAGTLLNSGNVAFGDGVGGDVVTITNGVVHTAGTTSLGGTLRTAGNAVQFAGTTLISSSAIDSTNNTGTPAGATITLGNVEGTTSGAEDLTLTAGSAGNLQLNGTVGATTPLHDLTLNGLDITLGGAVTTGSGGSVTVNNTGLFTINGQINSDGSVTVAGATALNKDIFTTTDLVEFDQPVVLAGNRIIDTSAAPSGGTFGGKILFANTLDGGASSLTLNTPGTTGDVQFDTTVSNLSGLTIQNAKNIIATGGITTLTGGTGINMTATGTINIAGGATTNNKLVVLNATDWNITSAVNAGTSTATLSRSTAGTIGLGTQIDSTELGLITASQIIIGGGTAGENIDLAASASFVASTPNVLLRATGAGGAITQSNGAASLSWTPSGLLTLNADSGIGTSANPIRLNGTKIEADNATANGVFLTNAGTTNLTNTFRNQAAGGELRLITTNGSINTGTVAVSTNRGPLTLVANDQGAGGDINIGPGGLSSGNATGGKVTLHAADNVIVGGDIVTNSGDIEIVAGTSPGINTGAMTQAAATETVADNIGAVTLNAKVNAGGPGGGNVTIVTAGDATASSSQSEVTQSAAGRILGNTLTVVTLKGAGGIGNGGANITLNTASPKNTTAAISLFACPSNGCPSPSPSPLVNAYGTQYAAGAINYSDSAGVNVSGIGTVSSFSTYTAGNLTVSASNISASDLTFEAGGNIAISLGGAGITQINAGHTGSLNFIAGGNITYNNMPAGGTIGTNSTNFDHNLSFQAGGDVILQNSVYMGSKTLTIASDYGINTVNQAVASNAVGDVILQGNYDVRTLGNVNVTGVNFKALGGAAGSGFNQVPTGETLSAGGSVNVFTSGEMDIWAGTKVPGVSSGGAKISAPTIVIGNSGNTAQQPILLSMKGGTTTTGYLAGDTTLASLAAAEADQPIAKLEATGTIDLNLLKDTRSGSPTLGQSLSMTGGSATTNSTGSQARISAAIAAIESPTIHLKTTGDVVLQGGTATVDTSAGGGALAASTALISVTQNSSFDIGGNLMLRGGTTNAVGATLQAIASAEINSSAAASVPMTMGIGGNMILVGGQGPIGTDNVATIFNAGDIVLNIGGGGTTTVISPTQTYSNVPGGLILVGGPDTGLFGFNNKGVSPGDEIKVNFTGGGAFSLKIDPAATVGSASIHAQSPRSYENLLSHIIFAANEETRAARIRAGLGSGDDSNLPSCN